MFRSATTFAALLGAAIAPSLHAQDCTPPAGFGAPIRNAALASWTGPAASPCSLTTQITTITDAGALSAGFVPYTIAESTGQVRARFTLDFSDLQFNGALTRSTGILGISGHAPAAGQSSSALRIFLSGTPPTGNTKLRFIYPDASQSEGYAQTDVPLNTATSVNLGIELNLGGSGYLRYWIDAADFSAPPTGRIPATGYIDMSAVATARGLCDQRDRRPRLSVREPLRMKPHALPGYLGRFAVFAFAVGAATQATAQGTIVGTTCTASNTIVDYSNGAYQLPGPEHVHPLRLSSISNAMGHLTADSGPGSPVGLAFVVCLDPPAPEARCVAAFVPAGTSGTLPLSPDRPGTADNIWIVVDSNASTNCGSYQITLSGTLGDTPG
jgi:hypothetical protein